MRKIFLMGAIAREPELTYSTNGTARYTITVAGEDHITDHEGKPRALPWYHRVTAFDKSAEWYNDRKYQAGDVIAVDGELNFSQQDTPEGKRTYVNIVPVNIDKVSGDHSADLINDAGGGVRWNQGINEVRLIGHLTRDGEMRYTPKGDAVLQIGIGTNQRWTDRNGERKERAHFFDATLWRDVAESASASMTKGQKVMVTGRLYNEAWTDKNDNKRNSTRVEGTTFTTLERPAGSGDAAGRAPARSSAAPARTPQASAQPTRAAPPTTAARPTAPARPTVPDLDDFPPEEEDLPF